MISLRGRGSARRAGTLVAACVVLLQASPAREIAASVAGGSGAPAPLTAGTEARVAVRSGDEAPIAVGLARRFGCRLATPPATSQPPPAGDPFLFVDAAGTALFGHVGASVIGPMAYVGQEAPGGGRFAFLCEAASGGSTTAFHATLADGRDGIFRVAPDGGLQDLLLAGTTINLRYGPETLALMSGPRVDAAGEVVVAVDFLEGDHAILRLSADGGIDVLVQTGDALPGGGSFARPLAAPAVSPSGTVAFTAATDTGAELVAVVPPGGVPAVLFQPVAVPGRAPLSLSIAAPAINDAGQVAFLSSDGVKVRLQIVSGGLSTTLAATDGPAPGGGTFIDITDLDLAIDPSGRVLFGGARSNGSEGIYTAGGGPAVVAETGADFPDAGILTHVANNNLEATPAFGPSGAILFAAEGTSAAGIFSRGATTSGILVRSGDPIPGSARFVSFLEGGIPMLGGGPSLGPDGRMIFDARITGGSRGLFFREREGGPLGAVALDGGPAPAGGRFDGETFAYHSIVSDGTVAFVATAPDGASDAVPALYYGVPSGLSLPDGARPLSRLLGVGDREPDGSRTVTGLQAPSRLNRGGAIAIPVVLSDGTSALLGYGGESLFRVAGTGDPAPGGASLGEIFTGSNFLFHTSVPPALGDDGTILFGATTSAGDFALFASRLVPGGGGPPVRIIGTGDGAGDVRFSRPFDLQAVDRDAEGRVLFSAIDEDYDFGLFLSDAAGTSVVARRGDSVADLGNLLSATPRLALVGNGELAYGLRFLDGGEAILLREPASLSVLAAMRAAAPDGGTYRGFQIGVVATGRLSSDGAGSLAFAAATDTGPEEIVLFGPPPNAPPVASAGPRQIVECAGPAGTDVRLDGRGSTDPDGDPLTYFWSGPFGQATGPQPTVTLPLGTWVVTLRVGDGGALSPPDSVTIEVRDTLPPSIAVAPRPAVLWPPDGRMVAVSLAISVADRCDPRPSVALLHVAVQDAASGVRPGPAVSGADLGTADTSIGLRADRSGAGTGRTYRLTYRASDGSGNTAEAAGLVVVPHDQRRD